MGASGHELGAIKSKLARSRFGSEGRKYHIGDSAEHAFSDKARHLGRALVVHTAG